MGGGGACRQMSHPPSQPNTQHLCLAEGAGKAHPSHFVVFKCLKVLLSSPSILHLMMSSEMSNQIEQKFFWGG